MDQGTRDFINKNIKIDNPATSRGANDWLQDKIDYAEHAMRKADPRTASGKGLVGATTAWADIDVPTEMLASLQGARNENRQTGDFQYDELLKKVKQKGWNPDAISVSVNHKGQPYVYEGNTRIAVAKKLGIPSVPARISWLNGAENVPGDWHIENFAKKMLNKKNGGDVEGRNKNLAAFLEGNHPDVPKIAYHATNKDFSSFLPMSHFGTKKAAMSRLKEIDRPNHNVMPVHLSIKNPLNVGEENRTWMDNADVLNQIAEKLVHMGHPEHAARVQSISDDIMDNDPKDQTPHLTSAANILSSLGYDGIKYINKVEDRGSYSFIPLFPNQIKSAIGNQGTFDPSNPDITKADGGEIRFHGTEAEDLKHFDPSKSRTAKYHYLADDPETAKGYGKHVYKVKINPKKMIDFHPDDIGPEHVQVVNELANRLGEDPEHLMNAITSADGSFYGARGSLQDHVMDELKDMGYDAVRFPDAVPGGGWDMSTVILDNDIVGSMTKHQDDISKADGGDVEGEGITAYHGSPHDFEQFDTSKIGTGEGNQAYGSGLYFAQNEKVAKNYRDMLAPEVPSEGGTMADAYSLSREQHAMMDQNDLDAHFADIDDNSVEKLFRNGKTTHFFNDGSALVDEGDHLRPVKKGKGHMYEVHINAHPEHFLDWDEVLEDQSDHIKTALRRIADREEAEHGYSDLHDHFDDPYGYTGGAIYDSLSRNGHMSKKASKLLSDAGIKGIRYLDAGSRVGNEEPTHNYVVFDHNHVKVRRKYEQGGFVPEAV